MKIKRKLINLTFSLIGILLFFAVAPAGATSMIGLRFDFFNQDSLQRGYWVIVMNVISQPLRFDTWYNFTDQNIVHSVFGFEKETWGEAYALPYLNDIHNSARFFVNSGDPNSPILLDLSYEYEVPVFHLNGDPMTYKIEKTDGWHVINGIIDIKNNHTWWNSHDNSTGIWTLKATYDVPPDPLPATVPEPTTILLLGLGLIGLAGVARKGLKKYLVITMFFNGYGERSE